MTEQHQRVNFYLHVMSFFVMGWKSKRVIIIIIIIIHSTLLKGAVFTIKLLISMPIIKILAVY